MALRIINENPKYPPVKLIEPTTRGYIHLAAVVQPRRVPVMPVGREKAPLFVRLKHLALQLEHLDLVEKVTVYSAIAIAPPSGYAREHGDTIHLPRYDIVVLVETTSPEAARQVQKTAEYAALVEALRSKASDVHIVVARNVKRVGDVDKSRKGIFLFNYFVGEDSQVTLALWDAPFRLVCRGDRHGQFHPAPPTGRGAIRLYHYQPRALGWTTALHVAAVHQGKLQDLHAGQSRCEPRWGHAHSLSPCLACPCMVYPCTSRLRY